MVIQRWQSVFLLIVALVMGCFTFMTIGQVQLSDLTLNFSTLGFSVEGIPTNNTPEGYQTYTWSFFFVSIMSFVLPFINIFLFKNLNLQKRICLIELVFLAAVIIIGCTYGYYYFDNASVSWTSLAVAPVLAIVADVMAYNRICSDQRALRSADRIR